MEKKYKIFIREEDIPIIKKYTPEEFYSKYLNKEYMTGEEFYKFQFELHDYIVELFDKYQNTTKESRELQLVYNNIYNDNDIYNDN